MQDILILKKGAEQLGFPMQDEEAQFFLRYRDMIEERNKSINLTAITDREEVLIKHFLDSLSIMPLLDSIQPKTIIDVGTGAGFPGIPIKIMRRHIEITLLDSLRKRIDFLGDVIKELCFEKITTVHARAEDAGINTLYREKFDVAVSRAVAQMSVLAEYTLPLVKPGGSLIAYKSVESRQEIELSEKAIKILGGEIAEYREVSLPYSDIIHVIVLIKKKTATPSQYPRKAGKLAKNPIK